MPYRPSTAHALHTFCIQDWSYLPCSVTTIYCSFPQRNSLSMPMNMHYTPTTTHPTASTLLCTQLTQGITSWQNSCREEKQLITEVILLIAIISEMAALAKHHSTKPQLWCLWYIDKYRAGNVPPISPSTRYKYNHWLVNMKVNTLSFNNM